MTNAPAGAAGAAADTTATGAGSTGAQPDYKGLFEEAEKKRIEFEAKFTGLQGKYQQEKAKADAEIAKLGPLQTQLSAVIGEKEALALAVQTAATEKANIAAELTKATAKVERVSIIAKEFQHLLPFEVDGLLPDGTGDELKGKLKTFSEKLTGMSNETLAEFKKGGTPPPPSETPANSSAALFKQASAKLREGKQDEYDSLYTQALELRKQGK